MPATDDHWEQANHNRALAHELIQNPMKYKDWAIVVAFYAAVHYIEAFRSDLDGSHSEDHHQRAKFVKRKTNNWAVRTAYENLYQASRFLRYLEYKGMTKPPYGQWLPESDAKGHVTADLESIARAMSGYTGKAVS